MKEDDFKLSIAQLRRSPVTTFVGILAILFFLAGGAVFSMITGAIYVMFPILGFLATLYGFGVLVRVIFLACKWVGKKLKEEADREARIRDAQNPLI